MPKFDPHFKSYNVHWVREGECLCIYEVKKEKKQINKALN